MNTNINMKTTVRTRQTVTDAMVAETVETPANRAMLLMAELSTSTVTHLSVNSERSQLVNGSIS